MGVHKEMYTEVKDINDIRSDDILFFPAENLQKKPKLHLTYRQFTNLGAAFTDAHRCKNNLHKSVFGDLSKPILLQVRSTYTGVNYEAAYTSNSLTSNPQAEQLRYIVARTRPPLVDQNRWRSFIEQHQDILVNPNDLISKTKSDTAERVAMLASGSRSRYSNTFPVRYSRKEIDFGELLPKLYYTDDEAIQKYTNDLITGSLYYIPGKLWPFESPNLLSYSLSARGLEELQKRGMKIFRGKKEISEDLCKFLISKATTCIGLVYENLSTKMLSEITEMQKYLKGLKKVSRKWKTASKSCKLNPKTLEQLAALGLIAEGKI